MYILHFPMKSLYIYENENLKAAINFYFIVICISVYLQVCMCATCGTIVSQHVDAGDQSGYSGRSQFSELLSHHSSPSQTVVPN